jgi:hypothetical protein
VGMGGNADSGGGDGWLWIPNDMARAISRTEPQANRLGSCSCLIFYSSMAAII